MTRRDSRRPSVDEARPRVLFVDDERHVQRAFEQAAFSLGVVVELANSATQALRAVEQGRFDVIAVDLSMPGLDGLGMVERLREVSPSSAFVLVSGAPSLELPTRPDVHLDAFVVVKPWDPQVLKDTLLDALERAEELALRPSTEPLASVEASLLVLDSREKRRERKAGRPDPVNRARAAAFGFMVLAVVVYSGPEPQTFVYFHF